MRYNFVPALNPMAPCFCKEVKHTANRGRMPLYFQDQFKPYEFGHRDGMFFTDWSRMGFNVRRVRPDGKCWSVRGGNANKKVLFRTPTPWHKYQYRPAKKERNLTQAVKKKRIFMGLKGQYPWDVFSIWFYPYENRIERAPFLKGIRCRCYPLVLPESLGRPMNPKVGI